MTNNLPNYAPISISVYDRYEHFKNCIQSLQENKYARDSVLYIFSDAPKMGDESRIQRVRNYIETITGFKEVVKYYQKSNDHVKNNNDANTLPFELNGRIIRMEDDIVVGKYFLEYMNQALNFYEDYDDVFAILGHTHNILEDDNTDYAQESFILNAYGLGLWEKKLNKFNESYEKNHPWSFLMQHPFYLLRFVSVMGFRRLYQYKYLHDSGEFYGDYLWGEYMFRNSMYSIMPPKTLTVNTGYDGSGLRCVANSNMDSEPIDLSNNNSVHFPEVLDSSKALELTKIYASRDHSLATELKSLLFILTNQSFK